MAARSLWTRIRDHRSVAKSTFIGLLGFATWVPVIAWFNIHVAELTFIEGGSMYPFMNEDKDSTLRRDLVLNYKLASRESLQRGMVVTLRSPTNPDIVAVKRVIALEGDVVQTRAPYPEPTAEIAQGHAWVEGDAPPGSSLDSNTYGAVSRRLFTGRVTHVIYPFRKFGPVRWWEYDGEDKA